MKFYRNECDDSRIVFAAVRSHWHASMQLAKSARELPDALLSVQAHLLTAQHKGN